MLSVERLDSISASEGPPQRIKSRLPADRPYIPLAEALSWLGYRVALSDGRVWIERSHWAGDYRDLRVVRRLEHVSPEGFARFREQLRPYRPSGELGLNAKPPCAEYWSDMDGVRVEWRDGTGNDKLNLNFGCDPENRRAMAEALRAAPNAFGLGPLNLPWGQWVATTPS